jgi:hypothetical protein
VNPSSWRWLQRQAEYQSKRITYLGAALAGLGLFGAGDMAAGIFNQTPWLRLAFLVLALATAASLGLAWEPCQRTIAEVDRDHSHELDRQRTHNLPSAAHGWFRVASLLLFFAAAVLVAAAVWTALRPVSR